MFFISLSSFIFKKCLNLINTNVKFLSSCAIFHKGISLYLFCVYNPFIRIMLVCERNKGVAHTKHVHCSPMMGDSTC
ncbi:hypothetical protein AB205_0129230 [Aquarana catesbeiana]|uniref:Uncharacterized protein n=1 Tax=Aquarana catesbeiana TaxID=8400 RepID=A0A2G9RTV0_AQUCT|nr:hypothetical protein AB205_0129230 [Aquarana catesbeiana]